MFAKFDCARESSVHCAHAQLLRPRATARAANPLKLKREDRPLSEQRNRELWAPEKGTCSCSVAVTAQPIVHIIKFSLPRKYQDFF